MLADRVYVVHCPKRDPEKALGLETSNDEGLDAEDILSSSLTSLYPDDTRNQWGDPDTTIVYRSGKFGDIDLALPDPKGEDNRKLFAHYLWNAGVYCAEAIARGGNNHNGDQEGHDSEGAMSATIEPFRVESERVLELGAGVGLGGIVSALAGAKEVVISDYPASEVLGNLQHNVDANAAPSRPGISNVQVHGHQWGQLEDDLSQSRQGQFTRIIAADCLWMPWEHQNLAKSLCHFLSQQDASARALIVAGFHTGRAKVAPFFEEAVPEAGLALESIEEIDVEGNRRAWARERDGGKEHVTERKRWLVVAVLKHPSVTSS